MAKLYRDKNGNKLYPVCSWEANQHKLYNAHDRLMVAYYEGDADYEEVLKVEEAMSAFDRYVINGIVYATYGMGQIIKDYIWAYNARH